MTLLTDERASACPVCGAAGGAEALCEATLGYGTLFRLVECAECGVRHLDPLPSVEQLQNFYRAEYYGSDWYKQQGWGKAFARSVLAGRAPGRFLDVGCGLGYFIDGVRKSSGWEVYGVEFSESAVGYARTELGLDVRQGELSRAGFGENFFDYVQIRNVLEHVTDPVGLLRECRRILKPSGTLHLFVPNGSVDSLDLIRYGREEGRPALSKSGHVFFFPARTLRRMFDETGFTLERGGTYGIRRGLASLKLWPRSARWKKYYAPKEGAAPAAEEGAIRLPKKKNRPDLYYRYRLLRMQLRTLPGMRRFGLDYELLLRPRK